MGASHAEFDPDCRRCGRLAGFLDKVRERHPVYHCRPVAPFGSTAHQLLIVGLAPGLHGANRTGRPFTGDHAGILLYKTLHAHGFASAPESISAHDAQRLFDCRITNAVKCLPPANKPLPAEVQECNRYLVAELLAVPAGGVILALGSIAHSAVLRALRLKPAHAHFAHGAEHELPERRVLLDSYHCSRYNTQTRRLTTPMFDRIFVRARHLLAG
jgi:uracil-DNA glycosylase family 4